MPVRTRIAFHFPYARDLTGGPRSLLNLLAAIDRDRFEPIVILPAECPLAEAARARDVEVIRLPPPPELEVYGGGMLRASTLGKFRAWRALRLYSRLFESSLRALGAALVWNRGLRAVLATAPAARRIGIPCVWDIGIEEPARGLGGFLRRRALGSVSLVVTQGASQAEEIFGARAARRHGAKLSTNTPGLDPRRVTELALARSRQGDRRDRTILCVGTLSPRKNQALLVRAFRRIAAVDPDVRLELVGSEDPPSYAMELRAYIAGAGLGDRVELLGWRDDVADRLARSLILALTSRNEGVPHIVRDALPSGTPSVATAVGGVRDAVRDGSTGLLVPSEDEDALVNALSRLLGDSELRTRLAAEGRRASLENTLAAWGQRYSEALGRLIEGHSLDRDGGPDGSRKPEAPPAASASERAPGRAGARLDPRP
jgi:glycosyltransferase involved in cell wall biosynthesis